MPGPSWAGPRRHAATWTTSWPGGLRSRPQLTGAVLAAKQSLLRLVIGAYVHSLHPYFCNAVDLKVRTEGGDVYYEVSMADVRGRCRYLHLRARAVPRGWGRWLLS
jgi:hypothetical protein